MWEKKILRGGRRTNVWGEYTKYNKIYKNSENFRGARLMLGGASFCANERFDCTYRDAPYHI